MSIIDRILEFGAGFDWLTPASSLLSGDLTVSCPRSWAGAIDHELAAVGVRTRRNRVWGRDYLFDVDPADADVVRSVLERFA